MGIVRRHPNLTVVPAPMQFERSASGANADLLVVDVNDGRVVGVQTKTTTRQSTYQRYDSSRIVIVDGTKDLGTVRVVSIQKDSSTPQPKPWPGIIAASRVHALKLHGSARQVPPDYVRSMVAHKIRARAAVGDLRVDHRELSKEIEERILSKL
jgi:hypothetical protein